MTFEKMIPEVKETLTEAEHRKILAKRIEEASELLWRAHIGLNGNKFQTESALSSYENVLFNVNQAISLLPSIVRSLEEGQKAFGAPTVNNKR